MSDEPKPEERTVLELLVGNLKVIGWSLMLAIFAYALWRGTAWLFPDISWLQIKSDS